MEDRSGTVHWYTRTEIHSANSEHNLPRSEEVQRLAEHIVVDEASVHGEDTHHEDKVPSGEHGVPDLTTLLEVLQFVFLVNEVEGSKGHDGAVT